MALAKPQEDVQRVTPDGVFISYPTGSYGCADPDKYRLPLKNDLIPFDFGDSAGG